MSPMSCVVFMYYRDGQPYYVGSGSLRRAYDWTRTNKVSLPDDPRDIRIVVMGTSESDALQAEILLMFLYGLKSTKARRSEEQSALMDAEFHEHNTAFRLQFNEAGAYWYSALYPEIKRKGFWLRRRGPQKKSTYQPALTELQKEKLSRLGEPLEVANARYDAVMSFVFTIA